MFDIANLYVAQVVDHVFPFSAVTSESQDVEPELTAEIFRFELAEVTPSALGLRTESLMLMDLLDDDYSGHTAPIPDKNYEWCAFEYQGHVVSHASLSFM